MPLVHIADGPNDLEMLRVANMGSMGDPPAGSGWAGINNLLANPAGINTPASPTVDVPYNPGPGYDPALAAAAQSQFDKTQAAMPMPPVPGQPPPKTAAAGPKESDARFIVGQVSSLIGPLAQVFQKQPRASHDPRQPRSTGKSGGGGSGNIQTYALVGGGLLLVGVLAFALSSPSKKKRK